MKSLAFAAATLLSLPAFALATSTTATTTTTPAAATKSTATTTTVTTTTSTGPALKPRNPFSFRGGFYGAFAPAIPSIPKPNTYGIGGVAEPGFALTDWLLIGLRIDAGILVAIDIATIGGGSVNAGLTGFGAGLLKLELGTPGDGFRIFAAANAGPYYLADLSALAGGGGAGAGITAGTFWGAVPEVGFDFGGFRIAGLYHYFFGLPQANFFALELSWR